MKKIFIFFFLFPLMQLQAATNNTVNAIVLTYMEQEKGVEPYQTRIFVTSQYMRLDDGGVETDYILYDRKKDVIYNVNHDDKTIMLIYYHEVQVKPPFSLTKEVLEQKTQKTFPANMGVKPKHYRFLTNDEHCFDVVAAKGLLNDVVSAMKGFNRILASNSAITLETLPADMQYACMLSKSIFDVNQGLEYGLPIQEWDVMGKSRTLMDFKESSKQSTALFELPNGYHRFTMQDLREGKVTIPE